RSRACPRAVAYSSEMLCTCGASSISLTLELVLGHCSLFWALAFCLSTQPHTRSWLPSTLAAPRTPLGASAGLTVKPNSRPLLPSTQRLCSTQNVGTVVLPLLGGITRLEMIVRSCLPPLRRSPSCR